MKCKGKQDVKDAQKSVSKNGRNMVKAKCVKCDTRCCKFVKATS